MSKVKEQFDANALKYDQQRQKLIPCFNDFYAIPVSLLTTKKSAPTILDIGAGTGLLSFFVLEKFPEAKLTLIDFSEKMLAVAKNRFKDHPNVDYILADYTTYFYQQNYDFIISSLSIHHLTDVAKQQLYDKIYTLLNPDGIFINADQLLGHTAYLDSLYKDDWKKKIESTDLTKAELQAAYERTTQDRMATLANQMNWLEQSGFQHVDCVYKYFNFVVLYGEKH